MKNPIAAAIESRAVRMPNMKFSTPSRISPAMPIAKPPAQRAMPDADDATADNTFRKAFPMSFNVILISSNFKLLLLSYLFRMGGRVESFFFSPLRMSDVPLGRLPTAHRSFSFQGLLKGRDSGMQGLPDKIRPEPARVEIFPGNRKRLDLAAPNNPGITFAPATKMTTDAVWNGGTGTLAIHLERRKGKGESVWHGATRHRKRRKGRRNGQERGSSAFLSA